MIQRRLVLSREGVKIDLSAILEKYPAGKAKFYYRRPGGTFEHEQGNIAIRGQVAEWKPDNFDLEYMGTDGRLQVVITDSSGEKYFSEYITVVVE